MGGGSLAWEKRVIAGGGEMYVVVVHCEGKQDYSGAGLIERAGGSWK